MNMEFLGKPIEYWLELEARAKEIKAEELLLEITELKYRISVYEETIKRITLITP